MANHLIVVVNRVKARFFTLEPINYPKNASSPKIVEIFSLLNPEGMLQLKELYTDPTPGRGSVPAGGSIHDYQDKRENHMEELRRRFAVKISARIHSLTKVNNYGTVIVAPSAKMRRFLYPHLDILALKGIAVYKVPKNMINFSPTKIHNLLANYGLAPKQKRQLA
jgi:hypothetical protein